RPREVYGTQTVRLVQPVEHRVGIASARADRERCRVAEPCQVDRAFGRTGPIADHKIRAATSSLAESGVPGTGYDQRGGARQRNGEDDEDGRHAATAACSGCARTRHRLPTRRDVRPLALDQLRTSSVNTTPS